MPHDTENPRAALHASRQCVQPKVGAQIENRPDWPTDPDTRGTRHPVVRPELASEDPEITAAAILDAAAIALWKSSPAAAISCITGHFVGMTVAYVECNGECGDQEFFVDGGENRDITIHAAKPHAAQKIISE